MSSSLIICNSTKKSINRFLSPLISKLSFQCKCLEWCNVHGFGKDKKVFRSWIIILTCDNKGDDAKESFQIILLVDKPKGFQKALALQSIIYVGITICDLNLTVSFSIGI